MAMTFVLATILGLIPGAIAYRKGRSFGKWAAYGCLLFLVAFIHSLLISSRPRTEGDVVP